MTTSTEREHIMKYKELTTKKAKVAFIRERLQCDATWALRGLVRIYEYQTAHEQSVGDTVENNGVGFSGINGDILSSFAEQVKKGRTLSLKQMSVVYGSMPMYAAQLQRIVDNNNKEVA